MNLKCRLKNKTFVVTMAVAIVAFIYQILAILNVVPTITQDQVTELVMLVVNILVGLGILVDPTTAGITDRDKDNENKGVK